MDQPDREAEPHFSQPFRQVVLMLAVLGLSGFGGFLALPRVLPVFQSNPYLNGFILIVFVVGVLACFWQVAQLMVSVQWIERFTARGDQGVRATPPRLLAPLAALLRSRRDKRMQITATSTRSILDSVAQRIDEAREITRYIVSLLIFLGLLGTFYGLATVVPALVETIQSLAPQEGETGTAAFARLMSGLEGQLGGMGVAFASSLLGLACSLVVGLLELFAGHGQNRFYRELEEWLSSITRLGFSHDGEGPDLGPAGLVLDQMAEQMDRLQYLFAEAEQGRSEVDTRLAQLADSVERLTERIEATSPSASSLARIAEGQELLAQAIREKESDEGLDAESRMRLRSIDVQMLRILEEISAGRQESMAELRTDLAALSRSLGTTRNSRPRGDG
ncbi:MULTISPECIES: biopolymer transporter ExbB [Mameliella]|uniref:MotA/TolQ/ExbB proton channel family protein n=1 Tax=Mameliella alba TaxID=561184 RepID=A0A0B3S7X5_9RHOB|nr:MULTISPECIES: biopolymer transporter ExbB [Mameliella]MBV6637647.1 biopolymer transporter ExbB [Mameliella sp.]MCR9272534.1 biopolymer transporter ExbB [Paracoccaceae bacterium]ODM50193.1 biopolymer transporter ExbB [Ruegeria sp. PBVC088]KHQ52781.1 MotA/TolQ/ExbB proton channel family protein [Mameliella alba]MBY6117867.1 biopolymer transporter ExbB [Mameliella alba]